MLYKTTYIGIDSLIVIQYLVPIVNKQEINLDFNMNKFSNVYIVRI